MAQQGIPDIEKQILALLKKKKKDYLTITQIRNGLSKAVLKHIGIRKETSAQKDVLKKLKPYFGADVWEYRAQRTTYIGYYKSSEEIILDKIKENPGSSSKNLAKNLPMLKKDFIATLNRLLEKGTVSCTLNENHIPLLKISDKTKTQSKEKYTDDRVTFKTAYNKVSNGRGVVRIHKIREYLNNWSKERFENVLKDLMADYTIELHGGDPSMMTEKEIKDSFTDEAGLLYINLTWWGENN